MSHNHYLLIIGVHLHANPVTWKGDPIGHIGARDAFFYVHKGECYVRIEDSSFIIKSGELAFLPKDKMRIYSTISSDFVMYEYNFEYHFNGDYWANVLKVGNGDYSVPVDDPQQVINLFERALRNELNADIMYDIISYASLSELIKQYVSKRREFNSKYKPFKNVVKYIEDNISKKFTIDELAEIACMQPSYFIKLFKESFGITPIVYINKMKMYKAMTILASSDCSLEKAGEKVGIADSSYFSKLFKRYCYTTPAEYRKMFNKF